MLLDLIQKTMLNIQKIQVLKTVTAVSKDYSKLSH